VHSNCWTLPACPAAVRGLHQKGQLLLLLLWSEAAAALPDAAAPQLHDPLLRLPHLLLFPTPAAADTAAAFVFFAGAALKPGPGVNSSVGAVPGNSGCCSRLWMQDAWLMRSVLDPQMCYCCCQITLALLLRGVCGWNRLQSSV